MKIKVSETFGKKTTICVMQADAGGNGALSARVRTPKAMRSALAGIPIVSTVWIQECGEKGKFVIPTSSMFVRSLPTKNPALENQDNIYNGVASIAADLARAKNPKQALPLSHMSVYLCGTFSASKRSDMQTISKEAGAKLLASLSDVLSKLQSRKSVVVLICEATCTIPAAMGKKVLAALQHDPKSVLIVNPKWLFDSLTCATPLPATHFVPKSPKAQELWQYSKSAVEAR